jgi:hypothetical protein
LVRSVVGTDNHGHLGAASGGLHLLQLERLGTKAISVPGFFLSAIALGELREE